MLQAVNFVEDEIEIAEERGEQAAGYVIAAAALGAAVWAVMGAEVGARCGPGAARLFVALLPLFAWPLCKQQTRSSWQAVYILSRTVLDIQLYPMTGRVSFM